MRNSFRNNLEVLLAETKSVLLVRLNRCNFEYVKKASQWADFNEALCEFFEDNNAELRFTQKRELHR